MSEACELFARRLSDCLSNAAVDEAFADLEGHLKDCKTCQKLSLKMFRTDRILSEMVAETSAAQMAKRLHQALNQNKQMSAEPEKEQGNITVISSARKQHSSIRMKVFLSVAACVVVGILTFVFNTMFDHSELAVVVTADPGVTIESYNGKTYQAKPGMVLYTGDRVKTPKQGEVVLQYTVAELREASKLKLESDTYVKLWEEKKSKRLSLMRGALVCNLDRQKKGREMVLLTPLGKATVLGTRFRLRSTDEMDEIMVAHGVVKFSSLKSSSKHVTVSQYMRAIIKAEQPPELVPHAVIGFNAEDGSSDTAAVSAKLGARFQPAKNNVNALGGKYIISKMKQLGNTPKSPVSIASYQVTFPTAGKYELYQRGIVAVNEKPRGGIYYGKGFGKKALGGSKQWIHANMDQVASKQSYWVNLSKQENGVTFNVPEGSLTQTLQIASHTPGLKIDALAFGKVNESFSDTQLDEAVGNTRGAMSLDTISDNLILWWEFEEGSGRTTKDSVGNYDGTMVGENAWGSGSDVKLGKSSLELMGDKDYMGTSLQWAPSAFTIAFWLKADSHKEFNQNIGGDWGAFDFHTGNKGEIWVGLTLNERFTNKDFGPNTLPLNTWTHFAFTYNNGTAKFYKNGKQIGGVKKGWKNTAPWPYFRVGHDSIGAIDGHVDDVRIYDIDLSVREIENIYRLGE